MTELEKEMMVARVVPNVVVAILTHLIIFQQIQKKRGLIGLRSTSFVARLVVMCRDKKFLEVVKRANLSVIDCIVHGWCAFMATWHETGLDVDQWTSALHKFLEDRRREEWHERFGAKMNDEQHL